MADNSTMGGSTDIIRDVDKGGIKTQVFVIDKGGAGAESLVTDTNPMPTQARDSTASGNITTQNLVPAGTATANSAVEISLNGTPDVTVQVTGTYTGGLSVQGTVDGSTWVTFSTSRSFMDMGTGTFSSAIASAAQSIYQINAAGLQKIRVTALGAVTGTAVVSLRAASAPSLVSINSIVSTTPSASAPADGVTNSSVLAQLVVPYVYNGTTLDRQRGMGLALTTGDTGAKTTTGNGATITNVGNKGVAIVIVLGTVTGTTPTCVFKLQTSVDGGTNWVDEPGAVTASLTASGTFGIKIYPGLPALAGTTTTGTTATVSGVLPRTWRVVWTIGGTTPSFTITSITYNYLPN